MAKFEKENLLLKKQDEIAVNMSGTSYFIVDVDSLVKSTVVREQARKAKEIIKNTR